MSSTLKKILVANRRYWQQRAENALLRNEITAKQYETKLKGVYNATLKQLTKEVEAFYGRYAKDSEISLADAKKRLTPDKALDFNKQVQKYLDEVKAWGYNAEKLKQYQKQLDELSGRAYISRIQELQLNIRHNIELLNIGQVKNMTNMMGEAFENSFYESIFDIQKQAGFGWSFTAPGKMQLDRIIKERWMSENYSDRIWNNKDKLLRELERTLSQNFVRGRNPKEVAQDFAKIMDTNYYNARRIIRTELNYISNQGSLMAYEESGVVYEYQYLATLDSRTSDICREMDGTIIRMQDAQEGINLPPLHPHCRSTIIPYFEDNFMDKRVMREEDGEGKSFHSLKDATFFEWVDTYGSDAFKQRVGEQREKFLTAYTDIFTTQESTIFANIDPLYYDNAIEGRLFNKPVDVSMTHNGYVEFEKQLKEFSNSDTKIAECSKQILSSSYTMQNFDKTTQQASKALLEILERAPEIQGSIFRVESTGDKNYEVGQSIILGANTYSGSLRWFGDHLTSLAKSSKMPIVYKITGAKQLDLQGYSNDKFKEEKITAGTFKVLSKQVEKINGIDTFVYTLTQEKVVYDPNKDKIKQKIGHIDQDI